MHMVCTNACKNAMNACTCVFITRLLKRYGVPHPYPLPSLWRSSHQEFSWADSQPYGIPISVEFL